MLRGNSIPFCQWNRWRSGCKMLSIKLWSWSLQEDVSESAAGRLRLFVCFSCWPLEISKGCSTDRRLCCTPSFDAVVWWWQYSSTLCVGACLLQSFWCHTAGISNETRFRHNCWTHERTGTSQTAQTTARFVWDSRESAGPNSEDQLL